jgi:hypothetical protein
MHDGTPQCPQFVWGRILYISRGFLSSVMRAGFSSFFFYGEPLFDLSKKALFDEMSID